MKILATIAFGWFAGSMALALAIGRALSVIPDRPPLPDDYLADQPVDVWSDVRVDAEFWALVAPYEVRS